MKRILMMSAAMALLSRGTFAAEVWKSTFDSSADGVVDVYNDNPTKSMIGPASGGKLQIDVEDSATGDGTAYAQTDRAGRPLGVSVDGHSSFSALYVFNWSGLQETTGEAWDEAGFTLSGGGNPGISRGQIAALMRHNKVGSDYYVAMGVQWGTTYGQDKNNLVGAINLGPNAPTNTYQLAISYFGGANDISLLEADLFDAAGNNLGSASITSIDGALPWGTDPVQKAAAMSALVPTHLGWMDYVATFAQRHTIWQVDSLAFYDTGDGALAAVGPIPEPASLMLLGPAMLFIRRRRR